GKVETDVALIPVQVLDHHVAVCVVIIHRPGVDAAVRIAHARNSGALVVRAVLIDGVRTWVALRAEHAIRVVFGGTKMRILLPVVLSEVAAVPPAVATAVRGGEPIADITARILRWRE